MLVVLGVVEQRHAAVLEVLVDGAPVTEVAGRYGGSRPTVHRWLRRYAKAGLAGLVDRPPTPKSCPHQMTPEVGAAVVAMRRAHPGWGPCTLGLLLARQGWRVLGQLSRSIGLPSVGLCLTEGEVPAHDGGDFSPRLREFP